MLERAAQVAAIRGLTDAARGGDGRLVVIEGSAGIGKTRLLGEGRAIAASWGMRVLSARGGELEGEFAYGIVRQLFEPLLATATGDLRAELFAGAAGLAEPLFAASQLAASQDGPGETSFAILHGLYWLTANVALQQPTVLAVDDLHWADSPSLRWLVYVRRRLEGLPLLLLMTTRSPEREGRHPTLVAELIADPDALAIRPEPLGRGSIAVLARDLHGLEPDDVFCAAVEEATGGNPLLVGAVLDAVAREGLGASAEEAPRVMEIGARGVAREVRRRLARLPSAALALVRAAAILGDGAELRLVSDLAELDERLLGPAVSGLVGLGFLRKEDPIEFFHPVVRSAVYGTLDVVERAAAHRHAAELLLQAGAPPENAAAHLVRTPRGTDPFVLGTLRRAGDRALAQGAPEAAVEYLTRAAAEDCGPALRADVVVDLGFAERRTNGPAASDHLREGLDMLADRARRGEVALELGGVLFFTDRPREAVEVLERALAEVDRQRDRDLRERLLAELIGAAWWEPETYPLAEAAIAELDLDSLHGGVGTDVLLATLSHYEYRLGRSRDRAVELASRALASGKLLDSGAIAFSYAAYAFQTAGLFDEALALYEQALARARRRGDIFHVASMLMWRGRCQTFRGDLAVALADLREATELSVQHGVHVSWPYLIGFLAWALLERGESDEAALVVAQGDYPETLPVNLNLNFFLLSRARLRIEAGAPEHGVEELLEFRECGKLVPFDNPALSPWRSWAALGLRMLDRTEEARSLAEEQLALATRWGAPHAIGASLRVLGVVEGGRRGEELLGQAVATLAGSGAEVEHARALVDLGAALRRANHRAEARERLRAGVKLAQRLGAVGLAERGNEEIAATGARPRKVPQTGLDALTASERRVAQLAAEGMSNKDIAQTLFVTVKTVEVHLSGAYRKLDITSRTQLDKALVAAAP
jgi:DNA-binding CsgD family transcriptional regulator